MNHLTETVEPVLNHLSAELTEAVQTPGATVTITDDMLSGTDAAPRADAELPLCLRNETAPLTPPIIDHAVLCNKKDLAVYKAIGALVWGRACCASCRVDCVTDRRERPLATFRRS